MHKAAERGHKVIVTYLCEKGADVSIKDHDGVSNLWGHYLNTGPRDQRIPRLTAELLYYSRYNICTAIHTKTL